MSAETLMIFAKAPEPGCVKTRLALPPEHAAAVHAAFVRDVIDRYQQPHRRTTVWRAGDLGHPFWDTLGVALDVQGEGGLGARMAAAFAQPASAQSASDILRVIDSTRYNSCSYSRGAYQATCQVRRAERVLVKFWATAGSPA